MPTRPRVSINLPRALVGPRILVRPYRAADVPVVWAAIQDSRDHLSRWLPWVNTVRSLADQRTALAGVRARWRSREDLTFGIFDRRTATFLGGTGLHRINWSLRLFETGYWIRRTAEGAGYITEAVQLVVRLAFDRLEANRVEIRMDPRNLRSRRIPERLGFVFEGILRRSAPDVTGRPSDRCVFSLIRDDYAHLSWARRPPVGARRPPHHRRAGTLRARQTIGRRQGGKKGRTAERPVIGRRHRGVEIPPNDSALARSERRLSGSALPSAP
jgi:RimJ/RimL family protein N-acetyltransferase